MEVGELGGREAGGKSGRRHPVVEAGVETSGTDGFQLMRPAH